MQKPIAIIATLTILSLTACGAKTDANEKNFHAAMTQYFDKKGDLCLNSMRWPVDVTEMDRRLHTSNENQMIALESAGLATGLETEIDIQDFMGSKSSGAKTRVIRYTLTDAAKPFAQEKEIDSVGLNGKLTIKQVNLCWGKKAIDKIVKWEGPMKFGDYQEAGITYLYKINNAADWARKPEIQAAFPYVKSILEGAGTKESKHAIKLTSQGWEAKGLD
jgi:hypothetical protein